MIIYTIVKRGGIVTIRETWSTGISNVQQWQTDEPGAASVHLMTQNGVLCVVRHGTSGDVLAEGWGHTESNVTLCYLVDLAQRGGYSAIANLWTNLKK